MADESELLLELDQERRRLARDGEIVEVLPSLSRIRAIDASHHVVVYSALTEATADRAIEDQIAHHSRLGVDFEWKLYAHDEPADMLQRLERRGFRIGPRETVLVRERGALHAGLMPRNGSVLRIERIDQIDDYRRVAEEVFEKNYDFTTHQLTRALRTGSQEHRGYVAYCDGKPVSIGRLYTHPDSLFAGLYGGGTLRSHRGRGFYRALVTARAKDAAELGARYLLVDALPTSRPILEHMGFHRLTETWPCDWHRSNAP